MRSFQFFVFILVAMLSGGVDAKNTGRPFEIGKKPGEKLVFVPGGTDLISFSFDLGNKDDYKQGPVFKLSVGGQKLKIVGAREDGEEISFVITDGTGELFGIRNPSQLNVIPTGFIINGTTADKYESKTPVKFEEAKDEQDAKYFSIKLVYDVPSNFVIKGLGLNEYVIEGPEPTSSPTTTAPIQTTVATSTSSTSTAEPTSESTTSGSNGRKTVATWLALGLSIGSVVSQALFVRYI